ncbi:MAG: pilus assembly protein [Pseudomonadota bacterium]
MDSISAFFKSRRGNVAMMFGVLGPVLIVGLGAAVDFGRASLARSIVQEATDAALLAAARLKTARPGTSQADLDAAAQKFFAAVLGEGSGVVASPVSVSHNPATNEFAASVQAHIPSTFMRLAGIDQIDVSTQTLVEVAPPGAVEVALVLDTTGSMGSNGKIDDLKEASGNLVTSMFALPETDVKFSIVPFAQYVNLGFGHNSAAWLDQGAPGFIGCVGSRPYPRNTEDAVDATNPVPGVAVSSFACQTEEVTPLTDNQSRIEDALEAMTPSGWTYIPTGLVWGWRTITEAAPFQEGLSKPELEDRRGVKAIVLMTDGANTVSPDPNDPADVMHNYGGSIGWQVSGATAYANTLTTELCENIKNDDVSLYTIAFEVTDTTIRDILESCANSPADYYDAQNSNELIAAFDSIGERLRDLSLRR